MAVLRREVWPTCGVLVGGVECIGARVAWIWAADGCGYGVVVWGLLFELIGPWCWLVPRGFRFGVMGGVAVQRLVWCFPRHLWHRYRDWQTVDLWFPRQLKHSLSLLTIAHLSWQSVITLHLYAGWGPLQYVHFPLVPGDVNGGVTGDVPWVWVRKELVTAAETPVSVWLEGFVCTPISRIRISLRIDSFNCWNFHSWLSWSRAKFVRISQGNFPRTIGTRRSP